jgi:uncharacterized membrane protein (UPF0127 family)
VQIVNTTRNRVLAEQAWEAMSFGTRLKGLLGRTGLDEGEGVYIRPCNSIHSFFMKFRFDAAFVDEQGRVLHVIRAMKPWRISKIVVGAVGVVELPAGVLEGTSIGDQLEFIPENPV